jgi:hypothetical protein
MNDISFLTTIARHPRFNVKEAMLALDVLGKIFFDIGKEEIMEVEAFKTNTYRGIYFNKVINPLFTMILSRYLIHELGVEFIFKFVKMSLLSFCKLDKLLSDKIYLHAIVLNVNAEEEKSKLIFEEDVILNERETKFYLNFRSLTKQIIVQLILDILGINNTFVNGVIKNLLIGAELRHYKVYKFYNIGLSKMLSHFGEPHNLVYYYNINVDELDIDREFVKQVENIYDHAPEHKEPLVTENDDNKKNLKKEKVNFVTKNIRSISNNKIYNTNTVENKKVKLLGPIKKKNFYAYNNAKTTIKQNDNTSNYDKASDNIFNEDTSVDFKLHNKNRKSFTNIKNVHPLFNLDNEQISQLKYLKEEVAERSSMNKSIKKDQYYVDEHLKYSLHQKNESKKKDDRLRRLPGQVSNNIILLDMNDEEDRDIIILKKFIKEYEGFFKEVFRRYCGSTYKALNGKNFEAIKEISDTITVSEVVKMFKQHNIIDREISKEDIQSIIALMNSKVFKKRSLLGGITYEEFVEDFIQISYYAFVKPPYVYRHFTIADYPEEMIRLFSAQFPDNMKYYNPETILTKSEREICNGLDKQLQITNFVKLPKTHKKILVTEINFKYIVPECMYFVLGESTTICLELVDEIIKKIVNYHTLEGFLMVKEVYKARPKYPVRAYPNMGTRFLFEQDKLKVLKERKNSNQKLLKEKKEKKEFNKLPEYKNRKMRDRDVISVGTSNIGTNSNKKKDINNLFDKKSMVSKGSSKSKVYNFFDKKSEMEFLKEEDD